MKILFIGSVIFSKKVLLNLINKKFNICGIITKKESKFNSDFFDLSSIAKKKKINFRYTQDINNNVTLNWVKKLNPDIIICCGWSYLLKKKLLQIPKLITIGYHPSDLPKNKGRHPIIWSIALGLRWCYSTFFIMNEFADSGRVISKKKVMISNKDNATTMYERLNIIASLQIIDVLNDIKKNIKKYETKKNVNNINDNKGNFWRKRNFKDGEIDWRMSAYSINNLVRALSKPYPNAHFTYREKTYKLIKSKVKKNNQKNIEPGKILKIDKKKGILIKTGVDSILIEETKPKLNIRDYYIK